MLVQRGQSMESILHLAADFLLRQTFILSVRLFGLLLWKLTDVVALFLWQWLAMTSTPDAPECFEAPKFSTKSPELLELVDPNQLEFPESPHEEIDDLIPALPDKLVEDEIWPLIARSPTTLFLLRGVNKRWKDFIHSSIE